MDEVTPVQSGILPADYFWLVFFGAAIVFEFASKDLLSDSSARMVKRHPILTRLGILALSGHLAVVIPYHVDVFNAKNVFHRGIAYSYRQAELRCRPRR